MFEYNEKPITINEISYIEKRINAETEMFNIKINNEVLHEIIHSKNNNKFYREDGNIIIESNKKECNCIYLFFYIFSKEKCKILLSTKSFILCKYWINGKFVGMGKNYYITELKKGVNTIIVQHLYEQGHRFNFSCRISDLDFELQNENSGLIINNYSFDSNFAYLNHSNPYSVKGEQYGFMLVPNDSILTDQSQTIKYKVIDYYSGNVKTEGTSLFFKKEILYTSQYTCDNKTMDYLILIVEYYNMFKEKCIICENIFTQSIRNYNKINLQILKIINDKKIGDYDRFLLQYYYNNIEKKDECRFTLEAFDIVLKIQNNISLEEEIRKDGSHYILYQSKLDGEYRKIFFYVSSQGDTKSPYPVIMNFLYYNNENKCLVLSKYDKRFIAVDVHSLGFTSGSYMGEACISEVIEIIKSVFNIDNSHIIATGYSNGATALWSYSIYHPEQFSAIYVLSGHVTSNLLSNIKNKRIVNISSSNDEMKSVAFDKPNLFFQNSKNYKPLIMQQISHSDLLKMQYKKRLLDWMFFSKTDPFPRTIDFTTNHMCHNKSYWVTINGISYSKKEASIFITTIKNDIKIITHNVSSFTIEIPPYINKKRMHIIINDNEVDFTLKGNNISFIIDNKIKQSPIPYNSSPLYKGLGLLYPYLRPLKVYLPANYTPKMFETAESFANPKTNGYEPNIMISYPIISNNRYRINDNSWIVIDFNSKDKFINSFKQRCHIKTNKNGYYYKNIYHKGSYCVFQIIENEGRDNKDYILYVNTNDEMLLRKNILIRRVIITSYFNGYNPYWNNAALIYDGEKYIRIFEYGMDEEVI